MPGLTIGWEYLTGYAVATDPSNRGRVEWPPHPARVFMALAAAWFETAEEPDEGEALRWLQNLDEEPQLQLPPHEPGSERSPATVYVPVNDRAGPAKMALQCLPSLTRSKQPRRFPRIWVGSQACYLHWPSAPDSEKHRHALDRLCAKVTRIGHSSSLVRMWVDEDENAEFAEHESWLPDSETADAQTRCVSSGMLEMLTDRYGESPRRRHEELATQLTALKVERKAIKGKGPQDRKATIDERIADLSEELAITPDLPPVRPTVGLWTGYRHTGGKEVSSAAGQSHFDTDLLVLANVGGPRLPSISTLSITRAMRDTIMKLSGVQPAPTWVCGHQSNGDPLRDDGGHLAVVPLPFVGGQYADGHLLGVGLAFPRKIARPQRGRVLGPVLLDDDGQPRQIELKLGRLGVWVVQKRHWSEKRQMLRPETWTAAPKGARTWASVTPVVLDRFPKQDRAKNRTAWTDEVAQIIAEACARIGLPQPIAVDIDTTSRHVGSPRAVAKRRRLRSRVSTEPEQMASLGDGFPPYPAKGTNASRPQVHAWLCFAEPVVGPILLGAGRYRGYGLFKPLKGGQ